MRRRPRDPGVQELRDERIEIFPAGQEIPAGPGCPTVQTAVDAEATPSQLRTWLNNYISTARRLMGVDSVPPRKDLNTKTITMFAVAVVVDTSNHSRTRRWWTATGNMAFVLTQVAAFSSLIKDTSHPTCNAVTDCPAGTYCQRVNSFTVPTCKDCSGMPGLLFVNNTPTTVNVWDRNCSATFSDDDEWKDKWKHRNYYNADHNEFPLINIPELSDSDRDKYKCLAYNHCSQTDMDKDHPKFEGHCDFIHLNYQKMYGRVWFSVFFLAALWTLPICQDIEEATIEENVLNHHVADFLNIPAKILRSALRIKRYIVPSLTISATLSLLLTETISSKALILNFLAIGFVLEADNIIAALCLNKSNNELMSNAVKDVNDGVIGSVVSFSWTRIQGFLCTVVLIFTLYTIEISVTNCDKLGDHLIVIALIQPFIIFMAQAFYSMAQAFCSIICTWRSVGSFCARICVALTELVRNLFALFIVGLILFMMNLQ